MPSYIMYQPENILCVSMDSNDIKLVDFGLARNLDSEEEVKSSFGTPDFVGKTSLRNPSLRLFKTVSLFLSKIVGPSCDRRTAAWIIWRNKSGERTKLLTIQGWGGKNQMPTRSPPTY